ncbi:MAG: MFS transporter [Gammaproteobacteria bacterium]|nr:MFS transporter [Gammaproteobacteria bacterium]
MKARSISLLVIAEIAAMALWFSSSAVLGDMASEAPLSTALSAALSSAVPAGFVLGALLVAILGIADRFDPRRVFALSAFVAGLSNACLLLLEVGDVAAVLLRFITGACLAGVYPVGMKIAVGWGTRDRGLLVGLLVGGLTLGSAAPHLLAYIGGADWRLTIALTSLAAFIAAALVLLVKLGPHHGVATRFEPAAILLGWRDRNIRSAFLGYLGHMWELYAFWAWLSSALVVSYAMQADVQDADSLAKLTTFIAIAAGALLCPVAGRYADRLGKARIAALAMLVSGTSALAAAWVFGGPVWLVFVVAVVWGMSVIPDSAQFSALIADYSPADKAGSLMTMQTALGFALTIITVQVTPVLAAVIGWPGLFVLLSLGPLFGIVSMLPLLRVKVASH